MRSILLFPFFIFTLFGFSQSDSTFATVFGGTADDVCRTLLRYSDGNSILIGESNSYNGDVKGNHGGKDIWVVCVNSSGKMLWSNCYGGSYDEKFLDARFISDRLIEITCTTQSTDGNGQCIFENSGPNSEGITWKFVIDGAGNFVRQNCVETSSWEYKYFAGNKVGAIQNRLVFFDEKSEIKTKKTYNGNIHHVEPTRDGGYFLAGESAGNIPGASGALWYARIDRNLQLQWENFHAPGTSASAIHAIELVAGNFYILGSRNVPESNSSSSTARRAVLYNINFKGEIVQEKLLENSGEQSPVRIVPINPDELSIALSYRTHSNRGHRIPDVSWQFMFMLLHL